MPAIAGDSCPPSRHRFPARFLATIGRNEPAWPDWPRELGAHARDVRRLLASIPWGQLGSSQDRKLFHTHKNQPATRLDPIEPASHRSNTHGLRGVTTRAQTTRAQRSCCHWRPTDRRFLDQPAICRAASTHGPRSIAPSSPSIPRRREPGMLPLWTRHYRSSWSRHDNVHNQNPTNPPGEFGAKDSKNKSSRKSPIPTSELLHFWTSPSNSISGDFHLLDTFTHGFQVHLISNDQSNTQWADISSKDDAFVFLQLRWPGHEPARTCLFCETL